MQARSLETAGNLALDIPESSMGLDYSSASSAIDQTGQTSALTVCFEQVKHHAVSRSKSAPSSLRCRRETCRG